MSGDYDEKASEQEPTPERTPFECPAQLGGAAMSLLQLEPIRYVEHLRFDMTDDRVEELLDEVTAIFLGHLRQMGDEALLAGSLTPVIEEVMRQTTWSRSAIQTPLRNAAHELGFQIDSIRSMLVAREHNAELE